MPSPPRSARGLLRRHRLTFGAALASALAGMLALASPASALPPPPPLPQNAPRPTQEDWGWSTWQNNWQTTHSTTRATAPMRLPDGGGSSGLQLTLPAGAGQSPDQGSEVSTKEYSGKGWYGARMRTANCSAQPNAGVKTGLFTYYKDQYDRNGNGIEDNSEIDIEFLCSEPHVIHLTLWTDYQGPSAPGGERMRKVNRSIDLRTGRIIRSACYKESFEQPSCGTSYAGEHNPSYIPPISGFDSSTGYWDYAFHWHDTGVNFYIYDKNRGQWIQLWDYRGPQSRLPFLAGHFRHNIWWNAPWKDEQGGGGEEPWVDTHVYVDYSFWPKR